MLRILMFFFKFYFIFYCVLVRVTVYVGCLSGVINDDSYYTSCSEKRNKLIFVFFSVYFKGFFGQTL